MIFKIRRLQPHWVQGINDGHATYRAELSELRGPAFDGHRPQGELAFGSQRRHFYTLGLPCHT